MRIHTFNVAQPLTPPTPRSPENCQLPRRGHGDVKRAPRRRLTERQSQRCMIIINSSVANTSSLRRIPAAGGLVEYPSLDNILHNKL